MKIHFNNFSLMCVIRVATHLYINLSVISIYLSVYLYVCMYVCACMCREIGRYVKHDVGSPVWRAFAFFELNKFISYMINFCLHCFTIIACSHLSGEFCEQYMMDVLSYMYVHIYKTKSLSIISNVPPISFVLYLSKTVMYEEHL